MKGANNILFLLRKYIFGDLSSKENSELDEWVNSHNDYKEYLQNLKQNLNADFQSFEKIYDGEEEKVKKRMLNNIYAKVQSKTEGFLVRYIRNKYVLSIAASLIFVLAFSVYFHLKNDETEIVAKLSVKPGKDKAFLRLANGEVIDLGESQEGIIIGEKDIKYSGAQSSIVQLDKIQNLEISTPKGGQYQIVLSDGTKVWLNAASSLKYSSLFTGSVRQVNLSGEAYFEVAKNKEKPFLVVSKGQVVKVLGTSFNVFAYEEENIIKTTLVEGLVDITNDNHSKSTRIYPGEEVLLNSSGSLKKYKADVAMATAWKTGMFYFKDTPFDVMIRQIARWYNIDVVFRSKIPTELFTGEMSRKVDLPVIMDFLKGSGINVELKGKDLFIE